MLNEAQKIQLNRLRIRLERTSYAFLPEEKRQFYHSLEVLDDPESGANAADGKTDTVAMQVLLKGLKDLVVRLGKNSSLYKEALDALMSLAPEMVAEAQRMAENAERERVRILEENIANRQEMAEQRINAVNAFLTGGAEEQVNKKRGLGFVFEDILDAVDRTELAAYIRRKKENALTREEVLQNREDFGKRADRRVQEELEKEKPDEVLCKRLHARADIMKMGWNPDDMEMVDAFLSIVESVPWGKTREEGETVLVTLLSTKVNGWEDRLTLIDNMTSYCEIAARKIYPDGNVEPEFREKLAKMLDCAAKLVSSAEYPEDPQFARQKEEAPSRVTIGTARNVVNYVMGEQDYEGLERKRSRSMAQKQQQKSDPGKTEGIPEGAFSKDTFILGAEARLEKGAGVGEIPRETERLILDPYSFTADRKGYLDAATGEYYDADNLTDLPKGIYFAEENYLFRITSLSQLDDLMEQVQFGGGKDAASFMDRIRRKVKQQFINQPISYTYRDEKERESVLFKMQHAQEKLLASDSDKYGMQELKQSLKEYRAALDGKETGAADAKREELIHKLRDYMNNVPEKIGRSSKKNLEYACDLLSGLQRENNFSKNREYDGVPETKKTSYAAEMTDCMNVQKMLEYNTDALQKMQKGVEEIGKVKEYNTPAFQRMQRALKECAALDKTYSIREMNSAYMELRMAARAFGEEMGWNGMEAILNAESKQEENAISVVQKLSRTGKSMADKLMDASRQIRDKVSPMGDMMYRVLEDMEAEEERKKERKTEKKKIAAQKRSMEKNNIEEKKEMIQSPVLKKK
ncbi:MAG: hypothetical protein K6B69_03260 [Lachnospiraceae bacterium]|nr:hypothetical protein [Lachnospiraceae bacterium]